MKRIFALLFATVLEATTSDLQSIATIETTTTAETTSTLTETTMSL